MKNLKKKNAFTMIELIFVIVVLGILVTVAIPKLSATRDDAKETVFMANVKSCIRDVGASYIATGNDITTSFIASFSACSSANSFMPSSIEVNGTSSVRVSNAGPGFDGIHTFGGTCILCQHP